MNWTPPNTETEWDECLSAYVDGELDDESAAGLEAHLQAHPERRAQLDSLRKTSALLSAWTVDAPRLRDQSGNVRRLLRGGMLRIAAGFAIGIAVGVAAGRADAPVTAPNAPRAPTTPAISQATAEQILNAEGATATAKPSLEKPRERGWALLRSELKRQRAGRSQFAAAYARRLEWTAMLADRGITKEEVAP